MNLDTLIDRDDLYCTQFPEGWSFTWRLLSIKEYRRFNALRSTGQWHRYYIYKKVFERCCTIESGLINQRLPLGVIISLGELIMYLSGDCEATTAREDIINSRVAYGNGELTEKLKRIIYIAFDTYRPEQLDALNRKQLIDLFTQAEQLLIEKYGANYQPLDVSKIVSSSSKKVPQETGFQPIDFEADNAAINKHVHPFDEMDRIEAEYNATREAKKSKLTAEQLSKLDKMR